MPPGAVYVGRPTPYGNPWPVGYAGDLQPWLALALGQRADEAGRRAAAVIAYRWWMLPDGAPFPAPEATPGPGDLEYADGSTRHIKDVPVGMGMLMLARRPIGLPGRPDIAPLRGRDLACWCGLCAAHADGLPLGPICADCSPCHVDVLLQLANV